MKKLRDGLLINVHEIGRFLKAISPSMDNDLKDAFEHCLEAIRLKPDCAEAHNHLGVMLRDLGVDKAATSEFCIALSCDPNYAEAHCNLGVAFASQHKIPAAEMEFREAIRLKPDYAEPYSFLGAILRMRFKNADGKKVRHGTF